MLTLKELVHDSWPEEAELLKEYAVDYDAWPVPKSVMCRIKGGLTAALYVRFDFVNELIYDVNRLSEKYVDALREIEVLKTARGQ